MESPKDALNWPREKKLHLLNTVIDGEELSFDVFPVLKTLLDDQDAEVRKLTVIALWDYPKPGVIDRLFDIVRNDPSQEVRSKAVVTLGSFIYEGDLADYDYDWGTMNEVLREEELPKEDFLRVKEFLMDLIRDQSQPLDTQRFAVEAISFLPDPDVDEIIRRAYEHPEAKMKVSAIFAMGRNGTGTWSSILLKELDSPISEIQFEATRAAGEAFLQAASPTLKRLVEKGSRDLQLEALWALGNTGGPGVEHFLEKYAESDDEDVREMAEAALQELELLELGEGGKKFNPESDDEWDEDDEEDEEDDEE